MATEAMKMGTTRPSAGSVDPLPVQELPDRLDYCRAMLRVHGMITANQSDHIYGRIEDLRSRLNSEQAHLDLDEGGQDDDGS